MRKIEEQKGCKAALSHVGKFVSSVLSDDLKRNNGQKLSVAGNFQLIFIADLSSTDFDG